MIKHIRNLTVVLLATISMALALSANAQLLISFTPSLMAGQTGDEVIFSGTITNTSGSTVFLNNEDQIYTPASQGDPFTNDTSVFFTNVPGTLIAGESYTGAIFGLTIGSGFDAGIYTGTSRVLGGSDEFASTVVGSSSFSVFVVPEPSNYALAATGAVIFGSVCWRRRKMRL